MTVPPSHRKGQTKTQDGLQVQFIWLKLAICNTDAHYKHGHPEVARKKQFPLGDIYLVLRQE